MNTSDILQHYRQLAAAQTTVAHDWHNRRQLQAVMQVQELPLPQRRQESWRYTQLPPLLDKAFRPANLEEDLLFADDIQQLRLTSDQSLRIVLHNGFFLAELSQLPEDGSVRIEALRSALANGDKTVHMHLGELSGEQPHLFNALNTAMLDEGVYLHISAGTRLSQPIEIIHVSLSFDSEYLAQPRLLVVVGEGAQASLVEQYVSLSDVFCLNNTVTEIFLQADAQLTHSRLQNESLRTRHLASLYVQQAQGSQYRNTTLAFGGAWSRSEFHVNFSGSGATCNLNGFYLAGNKQSHDMHLNVVHNLPGCNSSSQFKGILLGNGKAVFDGNIEVKPDAQKTDARLSNANLLLSRDAEIDTKPRLEIYADDVQCSHGTTVGQIDAEMLFYLRSRGIPYLQAMSMICDGFASEVIATCEQPDLEARARLLLTQQLATME